MPAKKGKKAKNNIVDSLPKKIRDKIYDLRETQSKSYSQISKELGYSEKLIGSYCRKYITPYSKKEKNRYPNIKIEEPKKSYRNHMFGNTYTQNRKLRPTYSQKDIDIIISKLLYWAHNDDGIYITSFVYEEFKQPKSWIYKLAEHHADLKEALELTRQLIAGKIYNHSWIGDRNSTFGEKVLPIYSADYKALVKWKAELAKQSQTETSLTAADLIKAAQAGKLLDLLTQKD